MAQVLDVAAYILEKRGPMTAMKLQKLVYYSQAWHLVWTGAPLFGERIEAWANGPVVPDLYVEHRRRFDLSAGAIERGRPWALEKHETGTIDTVLESYGDLNGRQLSLLTHAEAPWQRARGGLPATARSNAEITPRDMEEYYTAVDASEEATPVGEVEWDPSSVEIR